MVHINENTGEETKYCPCCKRELPVTSFAKNSDPKSDGYRSYCKECQQKKNKVYNARRTEKLRAARQSDPSVLKRFSNSELLKELSTRDGINLLEAFPPRILLRTLYDYGFRGDLTITTTKTVKLGTQDAI